jgi:farnesol dehydrogenase
MVVAITGGTGFLGSALTSNLQQRGHEVKVIARSQGYDVTRAETLTEVFTGAEIVFHLAALVQSRPGPFDQTNQIGLENVLKASLRSGTKRLIYVSSFTVFGPSGNKIHTETTIPERTHFFHDYERSKFEALKIAQDWRTKIPMNIVFPTVVYGPGPLTEGNIMVRLFARWFKLRMAALPGRGKPKWNFVYIDDVVQGLTAVAESSPDNDYILGGANVSLAELAETLNRVSDKRLYSLGLPDWLFRIGCHGEDLVSKLLNFKPLVLPQTGEFLLNSWQFSSLKAQSELGYTPHTLEEALRQTYQWMRTTRVI